ncbi:arylsulfatase, partial [Streptomyces sp. NPDC059786]|uniref:arylsulfatase n=1 Tax=Streptomyces sp. NPDC059786 TaxID=3346946 RepID=UPI003659A29C
MPGPPESGAGVLALLHTSAVHVPVFDALRDADRPGLELRHFVAPELLARARAGGPDAVAGEVRAILDRAVAEGAAAVLCTCSTIGAIAERAFAERTGAERSVTERSATARSVTGRSATERAFAERTGAERSVTERSATARSVTESSATERAFAERSATARSVTARSVTERSAI